MRPRLGVAVAATALVTVMFWITTATNGFWFAIRGQEVVGVVSSTHPEAGLRVEDGKPGGVGASSSLQVGTQRVEARSQAPAVSPSSAVPGSLPVPSPSGLIRDGLQRISTIDVAGHSNSAQLFGFGPGWSGGSDHWHPQLTPSPTSSTHSAHLTSPSHFVHLEREDGKGDATSGISMTRDGSAQMEPSASPKPSRHRPRKGNPVVKDIPYVALAPAEVRASEPKNMSGVCSDLFGEQKGTEFWWWYPLGRVSA
jgi:hypothetical protein